VIHENQNEIPDMRRTTTLIEQALALLLAGFMAAPLSTTTMLASSHMDAPLATLDPAANTTDVYAFLQGSGTNKVLVTALGVYPHQEPGIGPNKYNFDTTVLYEIHVATSNDVALGRATFSYQFQFNTAFRNTNTILQSYLGVITNIGDTAQNLLQTYKVTKVEHKRNRKTVLGAGVVPPNNQGNATPFYNRGTNGENPALDSVATRLELDRYTAQAITNWTNGYTAFAGQRDDGFYADIQAVFDLLKLRTPGKDSQGGFNIHLMALAIPVRDLGGDQQVVGVYATTSRRQIRMLRATRDGHSGGWVQVARQGNPLFSEALVAMGDKDRYSRSKPTEDTRVFRKYALNPELCKLINALVLPGSGITAPETNRTDIAGIYIPDLIRCDLSTAACRLAGGGPNHSTNPDDPGFSRLSIFGGDVLVSTVQPGFGSGTVPGGWPNGRRFGDDVVDIAVTALISDLRTMPPLIPLTAGDEVNTNDMSYHKVFPYEATPQNGRVHQHP